MTSDLRKRLLLIGPLLVLAALLILGFRGYALITQQQSFYVLTLPGDLAHHPHERLRLVHACLSWLHYAQIHAVVVQRQGPLVHFGEVLSIEAGLPIEFRGGSVRSILEKAVQPGHAHSLYLLERSRLPRWLSRIPLSTAHPILSLVTWNPFRGVTIHSFEPRFDLRMTATHTVRATSP